MGSFNSPKFMPFQQSQIYTNQEPDYLYLFKGKFTNTILCIINFYSLVLSLYAFYILLMISSQCMGQNSFIRSRNKIIMRQILDCYSCLDLLGRFRFQTFQSLDQIHAVVMGSHSQNQQTLSICFPESFPERKMLVFIVKLLPTFQKFQKIQLQLPFQNIELKQILLLVYKNLTNAEKKCQTKCQIQCHSSKIIKNAQDYSLDQAKDSVSSGQIHERQFSEKKQRRKSSTITGCADKELTETKNLNRHFRSKLREVHRDLIRQGQPPEDSKFIEEVFNPNRVGFEDIKRSLKNQWFNAGVRKQMRCGKFLQKILRGMMGIKSKKLMIKYYHVMVLAVENPDTFIRWKYQ